jgi:6-phosphogluconolactonase
MAVRRILAAASEAIGARGAFSFVLAGGETPRGAYEQLSRVDADWSRWHIWFGDERCLPPDDVARNSCMARTAWLDRIPIPAHQVHVVPAELGPTEAAARYATWLEPLGDFDLVLLGLGEDGHTASIFPGDERALRADALDALPVFDAPKPPSRRVTLSAQRLGRAAQVLFMVSGETKRDAKRRWRAGEPLPASAVSPRGGVDVLVESDLLSADAPAPAR